MEPVVSEIYRLQIEDIAADLKAEFDLTRYGGFIEAMFRE